MSSEESFLQVADLLPEALLLVAAGGTVRAANRRAGEFLGRPAHELRGAALAELTLEPAGDVAGYLRTCARNRSLVFGALRFRGPGPEGGVPCRCEGGLYRPRSGDEEAVVLLRVVPRDAAVSRFVALNQRLEALSQEIGRRQTVEAELRAQREWLRVTLGSIGDAVIATDVDARVVFMNRVAEKLTGWRQDESLQQPLEQVLKIINEETRQPAENPIAQVLREGIVVGLANHTVLLTRDGGERPIDDCAAPIRNDRDELIGTVMVFHDVTDRRQMENQLRERAVELARRDREKDEFMAVLAHELRNPLAPIRHGLHVARRPDADAGLREQVLERADRQARHLEQIVDDLLDTTLLARGQVQLRSERLDLGRLVRQGIEDLRVSFERAWVRLRVEVPATPVWAQGDPTRLTQVLGNLLDNACKFTPPGGQTVVRLVADASRHQTVLTVADTGVGIAPEVLQRLFEVFGQAAQGIDRRQGGLGLGLAVVRGLVELHGGRVSVRSGGPGKGTEFTIVLPLEPEPAPLVEAAPQTRRGGVSRRILLIEDSVDGAETLRVMLTLLGHEVRVAATGPDGVQQAGEWLPEVVLSDIGLPGLDGYGVARALRANPATADVLLIAITGYGTDDDRRLAHEAGFNHHLTKPADPAVLLALIAGSAGPAE